MSRPSNQKTRKPDRKTNDNGTFYVEVLASRVKTR